MPYDIKKERTVKPIITKQLCEHIIDQEGDRVYKVFFCLPSTKMLDIKAFKAAGLIRPGYTKIIAVEKEERWRGVIGKFLTQEGFPRNDRVVISKNLCDIDTCEIKKACSDLGIEKIDLWYIDTCNSLTDCMQNWICEIKQCMSEDAVIVTNFCSPRYNAHKVKQHDCKNLDLFRLYEIMERILDIQILPFNENARPICNILTLALDASASLCISYKENCHSTPMILTVQHKDFPIWRLPLYQDNNNNINHLFRTCVIQNLGYNNKPLSHYAIAKSFTKLITKEI